ncbi:hypothetical protein BJX99DRAFT_132240 [Aspergillus californicus]
MDDILAPIQDAFEGQWPLRIGIGFPWTANHRDPIYSAFDCIGGGRFSRRLHIPGSPFDTLDRVGGNNHHGTHCYSSVAFLQYAPGEVVRFVTWWCWRSRGRGRWGQGRVRSAGIFVVS